MASGAGRVVTGSFVGTGASLDVRTVGFKPRAVVLENVTGLVSAMWSNTMKDAHMVKRVTAGTMTAPTSLGITPLSDGFRVGADTDLNVAAETVHWVAYE